MATYTWVPSKGTTGGSSGIPTTTDLYVSTTGNDGNSGTEQLPFATIDKARQVIASRGLSAIGAVNVNVKAGSYYITSTITFGTADSGTSSHPITYRSCDGLGQAKQLGAR